jgi:hypothetical protein
MTRIWTGRRTESVEDYAGVLISLQEAHLHSHSARTGHCEYEEVPDDAASDAGDVDAPKSRGDEGTGMLLMSAAEYSIEGLRREVRRGGKGRMWTDYESENACSSSIEKLLLTVYPSEVQAHKQGHPRHRNGQISLAAVCLVRLRLVC